MTKVAGSRGRKCHALVSQLFSYAVLKDIVPANIALGIPVVIPGERERVLTDDEVRTIWRALDNPGAVGSNQSVAMSLAQKFLASTAQRSGQVLAMKWTEIDFAERVWKCPASIMKKSRAHLVPLSDLALQILHEADQSIGDDTYVFASPETRQPMRVDASSRAFARLTARIGIEDAALHDFRRTATTAMTGRLDVPEFIAGKVMSHGKDGRNVTAKHYNMHEYLPEKAEALGEVGGASRRSRQRPGQRRFVPGQDGVTRSLFSLTRSGAIVPHVQADAHQLAREHLAGPPRADFRISTSCQARNARPGADMPDHR